MRIFLIVWLGQFISLMGSNLTSFSLGVWVYQETGSVTQYALATFAITVPGFLVSPFAGTLADRWDRRLMMILSDTGAGLTTLGIGLLILSGHLQVWHIYLANGLSATCNAFQIPAYITATTLLVAKKDLPRISGLRQLSEAFARLVCPTLGGLLLGIIALQGVILIDFATFFVALTTLIIVRFPSLPSQATTEKTSQSLVQDWLDSITYLKRYPGLLALFIFSFVKHFSMGVVTILFTPLVLSFASPLMLGILIGFGGMGSLVSSSIVGLWGGSICPLKFIFGFTAFNGLCLVAVAFPPSIPLYALIIFLFASSLTLVDICMQIILQKKVDPRLQGRIFSLNHTVMMGSLTAAYLIAGPLADHVFEPFMSVNGLLANNLGQIIGVGEGRGIALMFMVMGLVTFFVTVLAYQYPRLRLLESEISDWEK